MKRYVTELVGTYFLVVTIGMVVVDGTSLAPLAVGLMLTSLVYMGGPISGAHYNPAVTLGFFLTGTIGRREILPYIAAQLFGAWLAASTVHLLTGETFVLEPGSGHSALQALLAEVVFTLILVLVIFNVAISRYASGNPYYGVAIGMVVAGGAFAVGGVSGAAFNPAVGTAPMLVDALATDGGFEWLWLYWVGPIGGMFGALAIFRLQEAEDTTG